MAMVHSAAATERSNEDDDLYDPLTGLPGRLLQRAHLVHALRRAGRNGTKVAVLFLDVDDFRSLNDRIGAELADQVLIVLAARVQTSLREWAYAKAYGNSEERAAELPIWLHRYNWHRPHGSIGAKPPISRLTLTEDNVLRLHI